MPGNAGVQDEEYPGENRSVGKTWSASSGWRVRGQDGFDRGPKVVGNSGNVHPGRLRATHYRSALLLADRW